MAAEFVPDSDVRDLVYQYGFAGRGFYTNDQRIEFTGQEATFGVEAAARGAISHRTDVCTIDLYGEIFLNQPFDSNLLTDYALRESFSHNFETDTFEISQLSIFLHRGDFSFEFGRFVTPFGRYYAQSFLNSFADSPFLRSEVILFRETGIQGRWEPGQWRLAAALTNGGPQKDTNSSKAFIGRVGLDLPGAAFGSSVKWQDGIGSEGQKEFNRHVGADLMIPINDRLVASTEVVYDEYGLRYPGLSLDDIDWGRSIYNRQLNKGPNQPLTGWGYYVNLIYTGDRLSGVMSYGQFNPRAVGDHIHDQTTRRFIGNVSFHLSPMVDFYSTVIIENPVHNAQAGRTRKGFFYNGGFQFRY